MNSTLLSVFIPTFLFVSATPGMCMTLSLTLGMQIGVSRTLWMMWGELLGVGLVALAAGVGVATLLLAFPSVFLILKVGGAIFLGYLGIQLWRSRGSLALKLDSELILPSRRNLMMQGFVTAVANPKGWAFFIALLPPFIDSNQPVLPQVVTLISLILMIEWICLMLYATGGRSLGRFLQQASNVRLANRISGTLMIGVGLWLLLE